MDLSWEVLIVHRRSSENKFCYERRPVKDVLSELADTTSVATLFNNFLSQAIERVCCVTDPAVRGKINKAPWFDKECREKRSRAIEAGHRADCTTDRRKQLEACKDYRADKQRKQRQYHAECVRTIIETYESNRSMVWKTIGRISRSYNNHCSPSDNEFYEYFQSMSTPNKEMCFNLEYETVALKFLQHHDTGYYVRNPSVESNIINDNFTIEEVETSIDYLKNGKSPGIDGIPAGFIKCCKCTLSPDISLILNYIIGLPNFPTLWTVGLKSVLFESGSRLDTRNYRGITILPIIEKIFETIVYHILSFANDAFHKKI